MFDYQAGEKYKLTLIMVALAGLMAGIFFSVLLMPAPEPTHRRPQPAYMRHPDVTGRRDDGSSQAVSSAGAANAAAETEAPLMADPGTAKALVEQWLPLAWDLSAGTAKDSQNKAMQYMTADCAQAYQVNIWTADLAKQIDESGLKSSFRPDHIIAGQNQEDGSVVICVDGVQTLAVPGKGSSTRMVQLEYLVRQTPEGMRIAGISEGGKGL